MWTVHIVDVEDHQRWRTEEQHHDSFRVQRVYISKGPTLRATGWPQAVAWQPRLSGSVVLISIWPTPSASRGIYRTDLGPRMAKPSLGRPGFWRQSSSAHPRQQQRGVHSHRRRPILGMSGCQRTYINLNIQPYH